MRTIICSMCTESILFEDRPALGVVACDVCGHSTTVLDFDAKPAAPARKPIAEVTEQEAFGTSRWVELMLHKGQGDRAQGPRARQALAAGGKIAPRLLACACGKVPDFEQDERVAGGPGSILDESGWWHAMDVCFEGPA